MPSSQLDEAVGAGEMGGHSAATHRERSNDAQRSSGGTCRQQSEHLRPFSLLTPTRSSHIHGMNVSRSRSLYPELTPHDGPQQQVEEQEERDQDGSIRTTSDVSISSLMKTPTNQNEARMTLNRSEPWSHPTPLLFVQGRTITPQEAPQPQVRSQQQQSVHHQSASTENNGVRGGTVSIFQEQCSIMDRIKEDKERLNQQLAVDVELARALQDEEDHQIQPRNENEVIGGRQRGRQSHLGVDFLIEYAASESIDQDIPDYSLVPGSSCPSSSVASGCGGGCGRGGECDDDGVCVICCEGLSSGGPVVALRACGHKYHLDCIADSLDHSALCPHCRTCVRKEPQGRSPSGYMAIRRLPTVQHLRGNQIVIEVEYIIPGGIQKTYHENPGVPYSGCTKVAYVHDTVEGRMLLERLIYAFSHGLTFRIRGNDSGSQIGVVDWASIPHVVNVDDAIVVAGQNTHCYYAAFHEALDQQGVPR